jgi:uncharacterized membrane protein YdbT with pleckstrin-like domain
MAYLDDLMATDETIQRVARRHWVVVLGALALNALGMAAAVLLAGITAGVWRESTDGGTLWMVATFALIALAIWFLVRIGLELARWLSTQYVVTTRRVLEVSGLLNKVVRDSNLDKINDLTLYQSALGRLLGYGDIEIITGSDVGMNRLEKIADPVGFKRTMLDNKEDFDTLVRVRGGE